MQAKVENQSLYKNADDGVYPLNRM
ncbi:MAG: hypothetical protein K0Q55_2045, partial [Verrucomicrobia bacterium]|nr:hypothetical protein [Verrucomicrobiota bacterium]